MRAVRRISHACSFPTRLESGTVGTDRVRIARLKTLLMAGNRMLCVII
jgi:hypothetical protein